MYLAGFGHFDDENTSWLYNLPGMHYKLKELYMCLKSLIYPKVLNKAVENRNPRNASKTPEQSPWPIEMGSYSADLAKIEHV